ncbi:hypothetical protein ApAK_01865 [Thermoplasmatales archaeon AK]|nr:hypothetical protein [Thermoplasmatales archaeon AK]
MSVIDLGSEFDADKVGSIFREVTSELKRAYEKYGPFRSKHEAYGVILEELNEVWDTIRFKEPDRRTREEAVQLAAAVIAFINDLL